jgi:soluble lytic murein transglycosylase-like protein
MRVRLLALLGVCVAAGSIAAYVNRTGGGEAAAAALVPRAPRVLRTTQSPLNKACPVPARYAAAFVHAANETGLPLAMLVAVAQTESRFRPDAVSGADARGLLQVLPATAAALRLNADAPGSNVLAGARYLQELILRFGSVDLALAAYNAGPTAVSNAGGPPSRETETYVADVNARWQALGACDSA